MPVEIDHPWSTRKLTDDEIAAIHAEQIEHRQSPEYKDVLWPGRLVIRILDRYYLAGLRKGMNVDEARAAAPHFLFAALGFVLGWVAFGVAVVLATALWDFSHAKDWFGLSMTILWIILLVGWFSGLLEKGYKSARRRIKAHSKSD